MPLPGFVRNDTVTPERAGELLERSAAPEAAVAETIVGGGSLGLPTDMVFRGGRRLLLEATGGAGRMLSADEATARYGIDGLLKFDKPISESGAAFRRDNRRDELLRQDLLARNQSVGVARGFGLSMVGQSLIDPLGFASNFVPVAGEGKILGGLGMSAQALQASRSAALLSGAARGAVEAGVGGGLIEGVQYGLGHGYEGRDYSLDDALTGVLGSAVFGSVLGGAMGGASWRPAPTGLDNLAARIERQESRGVNGLVSPKGAQGLMQLMPDTARAAAGRLGVKFDEGRLRTDATYNRQLGREELRHLLARYDGDEMLASAAYNAGPGAVDKWLARFGDPRAGTISHADFAARIPFDETRDYVAKVGAGGVGGGVTIPPPALDTPPLPRAVAMLDEAARDGALARAIDDLNNDRMTDVGALIDAELARGGGARPHLDEAPDAWGLSIRGRLLEGDVATTAAGERLDVRHALVEADDLVASHDADLVRHPSFPPELAPRQSTTTREGGAAWLAEQVAAAERMDGPDLVAGTSAERGPPIIARDGTVEAGGPGAIALQRIAADPRRFALYRAELEARGHDLTGLERPVLVRVREQAMTGAERVRLARQIEADAKGPPREGGARWMAERVEAVEARAQPARVSPAGRAPQVRAALEGAGMVLRGDGDASLPVAEPRAPAAPFVAPEKLTAEAVIAADPDLAALAKSIEEARAVLENTPGVTERDLAAVAPRERDKPELIAEAVKAAAFCLAEGGAA